MKGDTDPRSKILAFSPGLCMPNCQRELKVGGIKSPCKLPRDFDGLPE